MIHKLRMSEAQYAEIQQHLLNLGPNVAIVATCGRRAGREIHALCLRELCPLRLREEARSEANPLQRPAGGRWATVEFLQANSDWPDSSPHTESLLSGSPFPDARVFVSENGDLQGWMISSSGERHPIDLISVAGDDLGFWFSKTGMADRPGESRLRFQQAFGAYTTGLLSRLSIAVVGCSGTGSVVVEQLARSGVGCLVLVDPDRVEEKNLNRILNTFKDTSLGRWKVEVMAESVCRMGFGTVVEAIPKNLIAAEAVKRVAECDVLFGCVDGAEGRYFLNKIASFYSMPYIDMGVRLDADGHGGISQICGTVHYLRPGGSSLLSRKAITMEAVQAEGLRRTNPEAYLSQVKSKYIMGVQEDRPAVISVNTHYASLAVIELLARLHPFRVEGNAPFAQIGSSLSDPRFEPVKPDGDACPILAKHLGRGDTDPLLDSPYLSEEHEAA